VTNNCREQPPSALVLLRHHRVASGSGLGTGLGTHDVRPKLRPTTPPRRRYIATCVTHLCAHKAGYIHSASLLICRVLFF
jgi:hypothetical protein